MGYYWTGTGFEEREAPAMPPPPDQVTSEQQPPATIETASAEPASGNSAGQEFQPSQDEIQRKLKEAIEKLPPVQPEARKADTGKKNIDAGPVRFDPIQGVWIRAEQDAALTPESVTHPAAIPVVSPQLKTTQETGSFFRWTSWFRTDSEKGHVLVTPLDAKAPEANLQSIAVCEDALDVPSSTATQDLAAPEAQAVVADEVASSPAPSLMDTQETAAPVAQAAVADEVASSPAPSLMDTQDVAAPEAQAAVADEVASSPAPSLMDTQETAASEAQAAVADEVASSPAPSLMDTQDMAAPEAQSTVEEETFAPATLLEGGKDQGGTMWQTAKNGRETTSKAPHSAGETRKEESPSRWFVLKGVLGGAQAAEKFEPTGSAPVLEVFSLAGGVGKTSLVATLGRAFSARGEHVLLVEATPLASLQYFFGACDSRPGAIRTFRPPASSGDAPIRLATVDTEAQVSNPSAQDSLATDIQRWAEGASRVIVDVGTGSIGAIRGLAKLSPVILVPLVPDVNSVVTANAIDSFFKRQSSASGSQQMVLYVLNQFDSSLPLHLDVGNVLRERLGERLLPFALERTPAVSEALAEGMTIMDYAPNSRITADFSGLAKWLEDVLAPANSNSSGRWSER